MFPQANTGGIGAGNLTNNYQRGETRTTARLLRCEDQRNRTSSHQIWGKASYMDAVVDDLTNYLGPDRTRKVMAASRRCISSRPVRPGRSAHR